MTDMATVENTITIAKAAQQLGITPNGLRYHIDRGDIETIPTPLGRLVVRASLDRFVADREQRIEIVEDRQVLRRKRRKPTTSDSRRYEL